MTGLIYTTKMVSNDIKMEFGLDKCARATLITGEKVIQKESSKKAISHTYIPRDNIHIPGYGRRLWFRPSENE